MRWVAPRRRGGVRTQRQQGPQELLLFPQLEQPQEPLVPQVQLEQPQPQGQPEVLLVLPEQLLEQPEVLEPQQRLELEQE